MLACQAPKFGGLLGGTIITETVFAWPGIGRLAVNALSSRDYPIVQGVVLLAALSIMVATLCADIAYAAVDPRITYTRRRG